ncbi:MAG: hypothetical protein R3F14_46295 [Polyangiaceae bacterium]
MSLAAATPLAATIGAVTGAYPRGDAELFDRGGVMLLEALRHLRTSIPALGASWAVLALVAFPVGHLVLAFSLALLGTRARPRPSWALARAASSLPTLVLIGLTALVASAVLGALVWIPGASVTRALWPSGASHDLARRILTALVVLVVLLVGVIHDLARAAAVTFPAKTYAALRASLLTAWRSPVVAPWSWAWRMFIGVLALAGSSWLGLRIGQRTPAALLATAFTHQLALGVMGWMRLSWLARAAHLVSTEAARSAESAEGADSVSGEPASAEPASAEPASAEPASAEPAPPADAASEAESAARAGSMHEPLA